MTKIYFTWSGLGDNLSLIAAAYNHLKIYGEKVTLGVPSPIYAKLFDCANFEDWCNYSSFQPSNREKTLELCANNGFKPVFLNSCGFKWLAPTYEHNVTTWRDQPLILSLCERMGLFGNVEIKIPLKEHFDENFPVFAPPKNKYICIMCGGIQNYKAIKKEVMQGIVNYYRNKFKFVQIGSLKDPLLDNVDDYRGCDLSNSIILLKNALFLITGTGGLTHLAAAAKCKAFVLQTGGEPSGIVRYIAHRYITAVDNCGICARNLRDPQHQPCFYQYKCIRNLTSERAISSLETLLPYFLESSFFPHETLIATSNPALGLEDYFSQEKTLDCPSQYFI